MSSGSVLAGEVPSDAQTVPGAVRRHASLRPGAVALDRDDGPVSYGSLVASMDRIGARLQAAGVRPGELVVVHGRVSAAMISAALAVMDVGAAAVPLDSGDPAPRVASVLQDCQARLVLAVDGAPAPAAERAITVLPVEDPRDARTAPDADGGGPAGSGDLAYALFTSGSTGRPKGVLIEHGNVMNYVRHVAAAYVVDGSVPVLPALTPMSFDASVQQVYAPLARGEQVWLLPPEVRDDPAELLARLAGRPGAGLHCVPSLWEEVLREIAARPDGGAGLDLRALFLGGEVVRPDLWQATRHRLPRTHLANVYGPTETTVQATAGFQEPGSPLTTGRPISGVRVSVRDGRGEPVPPGTPGEVYISGAGVGRGYLNRPTLTAERFLPDPEQPRARMFRTGDAGFLTREGALVVTGRLDDQMKVRGFRVEPGDVEAALVAHPAVARAAVAVQEPGSSRARLVAAVVGTDVDVEAVRSHAAQALPSYLVPSLVRAVDALPLAANGKLDRAAVVAMFPRVGDDAPQAVEEQTGSDRLRAVWESLLGGPVADHDDFFARGGHSLLATRLIARVRREVGGAVPLGTIFEHRTFADFCAAVAALQGARPSAPATTAGTDAADRPRPVPAGSAVPLSFEQRPLWVAEQVAPGLATAHVVLPLAVTGTVDENQVDAVLDVLVRRHEALHTVVGVGPEPTLRPRPEAGVPVERHDLRGVDEAGQERRSRQLALEAYRRPFDLTTDLPVRATWIRLADERSILLLTLHHIACDGVSLRILAHDAERAFAGAALAPVGLGYRDYAAWQQARWRSGALRPELDHWLRVLGTDRVPMVWSRPAGPAQQRTYRYEAAALQAPVELADGVDMTAKVHSTTPFVVLCAALAAVAARTTGAGEAALGALTANRVRPEFDSTVGLFAGTVVLRVPVARGTSFAGLLKEVHEATMVAHAHQELPLDLVVEHLHEQGYAGPVYDLGLSVDWEPATPAPGTPGAPGVSVLPLDGSDIPMGVAIGAAPLTLSVTRRTTSLSLRAEYSTDELDEARVRSLLDDLVSLLRRAHVEPATPVSA